MAQSHRSFTIRVPLERYIEMSDLAKADNTNLNAKVNELLTLGLGRNVSLEEAIARLLKREVSKDKNND
jgi:hypothetical protein